jgi:hypothetical protein
VAKVLCQPRAAAREDRMKSAENIGHSRRGL